MRGIDISDNNVPIDLDAIDCDFVIVKVSQGDWYENPYWREWADQVLASGRKLGLYFYAGGGNAEYEAEVFLDQIKPYIGKARFALDWESYQNPSFALMNSWVSRWMRIVEAKTGTRPWLYIQQSIMHEFAGCGYRLWVAQYASSAERYGWQEHPWNEGAYECDIRQYSSKGGIPGFENRDLDLNIAYITPEEWDAGARPGYTKSNLDVAKEFVSKCASHLNEDGDVFNFWYWYYHNDMPWCAVFQSYVGIQECGFDWKRSASAADFCLQFERIPDEEARVGDFVYFRWDGVPEVEFCDQSHVAVIESWDHSEGSIFHTIDGNSTGSVVRRNTYDNNASYFTAFFRPVYKGGYIPFEEEVDEVKPCIIKWFGSDRLYMFNGTKAVYIENPEQLDTFLAFWDQQYGYQVPTFEWADEERFNLFLKLYE